MAMDIDSMNAVGALVTGAAAWPQTDNAPPADTGYNPGLGRMAAQLWKAGLARAAEEAMGHPLFNPSQGLYWGARLDIPDFGDRMLVMGGDPGFVPGTGGVCALHTGLLRSAHPAAWLELFDRHRVDYNVVDAEGRSPLVSAMHGRKPAWLVEQLGSRVDVNLADSDGVTALMLASEAYYGLATLRMLLNRKADVNARDKWGGDALLRTAGRTAMAKTRLLLGRGADAKGLNHHQQTALFLFLKGGEADEPPEAFLKDLIALNPAAVNHADSFLTTPMHVVARNDMAHRVDLLMDANADMQAVNRMGYTPLEYAAWAHTRKTAVAMMRKGATFRIRRPYGLRLLWWKLTM